MIPTISPGACVLAALLLIASHAASQIGGPDFSYPPSIADAVVETYKTVDGVELKLWILNPPGHTRSDQRPAVVFFFGGGWVQGTPMHFEHQARALSTLGVVGVLADYRVASRQKTKIEDAVEDAKSAIRWVRAHATRLGIDSDRIGAAGGSAGGHLALSTATLPGFERSGEDRSIASRPDAVVAFNPAVMLGPVDGVFEPSEAIRERAGIPLAGVSPFHHVREGLPPTLILHGSRDRLIPYRSVVAYCEATTQAGGLCEISLYAGADHGFFNRDPYYEPTLAQMIHFLGRLGWMD